MKINGLVFLNFLKKVHMSGKHTINELIFNFSPIGVQVSVFSDDNIIRVDGILSKASFDDYEEIGNIGIQELSKIINIIKTFGDAPINININDGTLILKANNRKVELALLDIQFINMPQKIKSFSFDETLNIPVKLLQNFIADASVNNDFDIVLQTNEKEFVMKNTGKFKFTDTISVETANGGVDVTFGNALIDAVKNLDGDIQLSISSNYPCKILEKKNDMVINIIVAPNMSEE